MWRSRFSSARKPETIRHLYWKAASGAGPEEAILEDNGNKSLESWSPDGKFLLFNLNLGREIDAVPLNGDRKPFPVLKSSFSQDHASVSPDGRWIAYSSLESGRREVFVQNFPPAGGKWQISTNGGTEPSWRRDGKELYCLEGTKLEALDVKAFGSSFEAGIPKELFNVPEATGNRRNNYVATADGHRFLFITTQTGEGQATLRRRPKLAIGAQALMPEWIATPGGCSDRIRASDSNIRCQRSSTASRGATLYASLRNTR